MNTCTTCRFNYNNESTTVNCVFVHRLRKYIEDDKPTGFVCNSPVPLDRIMQLYNPLTADVLYERIRLGVELDDPLQVAADVDRIFAVAKTSDEVCRLLSACGSADVKATITTRDAALLAKPHHMKLSEQTRVQMLHHLARPRPPRKEGTLSDDFVRGMRGRNITATATPLAIEMPDDMFDIAEFTTAAEYTAIKTIVRNMADSVLDIQLSPNLFIYNFTEAMRKYTLTREASNIDVATISISPLYEQLGAGVMFAPYRPTLVRGFAHYKSRKNAKVTIVVNHVNYDVPKILYTGDNLYATAEFLADDLRLFIDIATNNIQV
jgi:hypothetical protein